MAIPGITYRLEKGSSLTHTEMDNNFRSVIYSSSIHQNGDTLRLHFDTTTENDYHEVALGGTGNVTIFNETNNRVLTSVGSNGQIQAESNFLFDGDVLTITGRVSQDDGVKNVFIGDGAGDSISGAEENIAIGYRSGRNLTGLYNTSIGVSSLTTAGASSRTVAVGFQSLSTADSGNFNVAIGSEAGKNLSSGASNVYLGYAAGPASTTAQSNKLYINNAASDTPLILGDFSLGQVTFNSQVSASVFSGSFVGDGSALTGLSVTAEWDGSRDGDAEITGSFTVSGSSVVVDFTNTSAISGSIFSGSFVGDGSGLTGVQADTFPYTGSAKITGSLAVVGPTSITGSFTVSGSSPTINLKGDTFVDDNIKIHNKNNTSIGIGQDSLTNVGSGVTNTLAIGACAACASTGDSNVILGNQAGKLTGKFTTLVGFQAGKGTVGCYNTAVGYNTIGGTGANANAKYSTAIGSLSLNSLTSGDHNTGLGHFTLRGITKGAHNTAVGSNALYGLSSLNNKNTGVGSFAGFNAQGQCNVFLGYYAGPATWTTPVSSKLYINNNFSDTPLIYGDFSTGQVTIHNQVSASIFSGSFYGNGSNLTDVEWDGSRNGDANITGSFTVSGSTATVDFSDTLAISGSTFSGSFVGDGSGLTGVTAEWDGTRNGNSEITGSLIVSGALDVSNTVTIASSGYPGGAGVELIHFHSSSLSGVNTIQTFAIDSSTGYTGFKADYSLTNSTETEKKIGTIYGAWNQSGGTTINDSHTTAAGSIILTSFSITSDGSTATFKIDASGGSYDLNILMTAFKRQV